MNRDKKVIIFRKWNENYYTFRKLSSMLNISPARVMQIWKAKKDLYEIPDEIQKDIEDLNKKWLKVEEKILNA